MNHDGRDDIISGDEENGIQLYTADGPGTFAFHSRRVTEIRTRFQAGDFNGDGLVDISGAKGTAYRVNLGDPDQPDGVEFGLTGDHGTQKVVDIDNDGYDDILSSTLDGVVIDFGDPDQPLQSTERVGGTLSSYDVALVELNGDGVLDIAINDLGLYLFLSDGPRQWSGPTTLAVPGLSKIVSAWFGDNPYDDLIFMKPEGAYHVPFQSSCAP